jgi:hypothetical protein
MAVFRGCFEHPFTRCTGAGQRPRHERILADTCVTLVFKGGGLTIEGDINRAHDD